MLLYWLSKGSPLTRGHITITLLNRFLQYLNKTLYCLQRAQRFDYVKALSDVEPHLTWLLKICMSCIGTQLLNGLQRGCNILRLAFWHLAKTHNTPKYNILPFSHTTFLLSTGSFIKNIYKHKHDPFLCMYNRIAMHTLHEKFKIHGWPIFLFVERISVVHMHDFRPALTPAPSLMIVGAQRCISRSANITGSVQPRG